MITLLTGLPGHGKGVYGLDWLISKVNKENQKLQEQGKEVRTVYYNGITDCKIPNWVHLDDPQLWYECPAGSFILIDECQRIFRVRANGSQVPKYISELETHRHHGFDMLLITQHPMLIDQNIRRLVGQHFHIIRKFGMQKANVHEFNAVVEQPQKSRKGSVLHAYSYNKAIYALYKSAEVHTVKRNIPMRYFLMFLLPIVAIGMVWWAVQQLLPSSMQDGVFGKDGQKLPEVTGKVVTAAASIPTDYFESRVPRIKTLAYTAPVYDEVTEVKHAPYPAACVQMGNMCKCYTQQGTRLKTADSLCSQIVADGFFVEFEQSATNDARRNETSSGVSGEGTSPDDGFNVPPNSAGLGSRSSPNNPSPS